MRSKRMTRVTGYVLLALAVAGLALGATGCIEVALGNKAVDGSSVLETREFDFTGFSRVEVHSAFRVDVTRAAEHSVSVTIDDNLFEYLDVSLKGDTLMIRMKSFHNYRNATLKASVGLPELSSLALSGAVRGEVSGFETDGALRITTSGASTLQMSGIEAGEAEVYASGASRVVGEMDVITARFNISGASTVDLQGSASESTIGGSGASTARLGKFTTATSSVRLSGASNGTVDVTGALDVHISGASRLTYRGNPRLGDVDVSGASTMSGR
jgi:hypothetical protein